MIDHIEKKKLRKILKWVVFQLVIFTINQIFDLIKNKNNLPWYFKVVDWSIVIVAIIACLVAQFKNLRAAYIGFFMVLIRFHVKLY